MFGKDFCINDGVDTRNQREIATQGIIDLLTELNGVCYKRFDCPDDTLVINGKSVTKICAKLYSQELDDEYDFDGMNDMFECFIIFVFFGEDYELLSNLTDKDVENIWYYMLDVMRK